MEATELKLEKGSIHYTELVKDVVIHADKLHLTNVVYNIIDNAVKYCDRDPQIQLTLQNKNNGIAIRIEDNGIRYSQRVPEVLFDKFYRVNTGNVHNVKRIWTRPFYVKSICKAHNWEIMVDSDVGKGSVFEIEISENAIIGKA